MTALDKLEAYPPEVINHFLDTGKSEAIDAEMQLFIQQIAWAAEINHYYPSITQAAKKLSQRVKAVQNIRMSVRLAKERIADAINFFHVDINVSQKIWDLKTADKLLNIVQLLIADNKLDQAAKWEVKANELRKRANEAIDNENIKAPIWLISNNISLIDMGMEKENLKAIAKKDNDGYYLNLINKLDVDSAEKQRLLKDAGISDVDFEEIETDGPE